MRLRDNIEKRSLVADRDDQSSTKSGDRPPLHRTPGRSSSGSRFWERDGVRIWSNSNYISKEEVDYEVPQEFGEKEAEYKEEGHGDVESGPRARRVPMAAKANNKPIQSSDTEDEIEDDVLSFFSRMRHETLENDPRPHGNFDPRLHWVSCWGRFCYELSPCQNWFLVDDPPFTQRIIDVEETFAPRGIPAILSKAFLLASGLAAMATMLVSEQHPLFCLAYFSTWNLLAHLAYTILGMYNMWQGASQPFSRVSGTVRATWFLFVVTINAGLLEASLFWANNQNDLSTSLQFTTLMLHGGLSLQALLDGFLVHRIPLRWMHWWGCCFFVNFAYLGWTVVHFFCEFGNPNEQEDANYIYSFLDWSKWPETLISAACVVFGLSPIIFSILWLMSMYEWFTCFCFCCWEKERRYYLPVDYLTREKEPYHKIRPRINLLSYPDETGRSQNKLLNNVLQDQSLDRMTEDETVYPEDQCPFSDEDLSIKDDEMLDRHHELEQSEQSDPFAREFARVK